MMKRSSTWHRLVLVAMTGSMLLQIGPCTGDTLRDALGDGARATIGGLFGVLTDSLVTSVFNLP